MSRWVDTVVATGRTAALGLPGAVRRVRRRLRCRAARARRRLRRASFGTWLLLVLVSVAAVSASATVWLQDSALVADLRAAACSALARSAGLASQLVDLDLAARTQRFRALTTTPQFDANLESGHPPTLAHFAAEIAATHAVAGVLFVDPAAREVAGFGDPALRAHALERLAVEARRAGTDAESVLRFIAYGGEVFVATHVPLADEAGQPRGHFIVLDALRDLDLAAWSSLCGGQLWVSTAAYDDGASLSVCTLDNLQLRVRDAFPAEREVLANSRANLLAGGLIGMALASIASLFLARRLLRPIRTIQAATDRIGRGDLAFRLDEASTDEVGDVARAFNTMLDRLAHNIDERVRVEQKIHHLACHDGLTGLGNRRMLKGQLAAAIERGRVTDGSVGVIHLGLDRFKGVNETLGHTFGDDLLVEVARRLERWLGEVSRGEPQTLLSRLAGDEFTVLLPDVDGRRQIEAIAARLLDVMEAPFDLGGRSVAMSASLGIALSPQDAEDAETLLRGADLALTQAKLRGGRGYAFFADSMQEIAARRVDLDHRLRQALGNDEFELYYQPKLDLNTGQVESVEALLRWRNDEHGTVRPDEFIPLAEETGAIVAIGEWVLSTAAFQAQAWQRAGLPRIRVAVNVSGRQLQQGDEFVASVAQILEETGLDPSLLELEITESVLLQGDTAVDRFHALRAMGVGLALDDFGTGYSSLSQLHTLPIDTLKVDRSFLRGVDSSAASAGLIGSIIGMAKMLDLRVVVEGVETLKQRRLLARLGCDEIQGFFVYRPLPASEVPGVLARKSAPRSRRKTRPSTSRSGTRRSITRI